MRLSPVLTWTGTSSLSDTPQNSHWSICMTEGGIVSSNIHRMYSTTPPQCQHAIRNACTFKVCLDSFFPGCTTVGNVIVCFCFTRAAVKKPQGLPFSFGRTGKKKPHILLLKILYSAHPSVHLLPSTLNTYIKLFSPGLCAIQRWVENTYEIPIQFLNFNWGKQNAEL